MAPFAGLDPDAAVELLRDPTVVDRLPLTMGGPGGPTVQIGLMEGQWCVWTMKVDEAAYTAFFEEQQRTGGPLYPEHRMRFLRPHEVLMRCDDREAMLRRFATVRLVLDANYQPSLQPRDLPHDAAPKASWLRRLLGRDG